MASGAWSSCSHCSHSQEAKGADCWGAVHVLLLQSPFNGCCPHSGMTLLCYVGPFWKLPHRCTQSCVSVEILNQVKLTVKITVKGLRCHSLHYTARLVECTEVMQESPRALVHIQVAQHTKHYGGQEQGTWCLCRQYAEEQMPCPVPQCECSQC